MGRGLYNAVCQEASHMPYFTMHRTFLVPSFEPLEKEKANLDRFLSVLEGSGAGEIIDDEVRKSKDGETRGRKGLNPYKTFAAILLGFSVHSGSLRKIEESIRNDLRFIYVMDQEMPSHVAISSFINTTMIPRFDELFGAVIRAVVKELGIDVADAFLDGTKIEANANKYKFVWRPTKRRRNLQAKASSIAAEMLGESREKATSRDIAGWVSKLSALKEKEESSPPKRARNGKIVKGKAAKAFSEMESLLERSLEYDEIESVMGDNRNSYFKTDSDATAMTLKDDYYSGLGSSMHAAYNAQIIVCKGIPVSYAITQDRSDYAAMIPAIERFGEIWGRYPERLCADAGYGSLANYRYLEDKGIGNFVKYQMMRLEIEGKHVPVYHFSDGRLICLAGREGEKGPVGNRHPKAEGYSYYTVKCPKRCRYRDVCRKSTKDKKGPTRVFEASEEYDRFRKEAMANLLSTKGIEMRVNRSAQVEGAFGIVKQDMSYDRFRRRGLERVSLEFGLTLLGLAVRRMFGIWDGKGSMAYWQAPEDLVPQEKKAPNMDKILRRKKRRRHSDPRR